MQIAGLPDDLSARFAVPNLYPTERQRTIKNSRTLFRINRFLPPSIRSAAARTVSTLSLSPSLSLSLSVAFSPVLAPRQINAPIILLLPTYVDNNLHHAKTTRLSRAPRAPVISIIRDKKKTTLPRSGDSRSGENCREIAGRSEMRI